MDDDELLRRVIGLHLRHAGARVTAADRAETALDRLRAGAIDLLVTDVELPGASGIWLARQVRRRWPELPVIVITGGVPGDAPADAVLIKPFPLDALASRIRALLDGGR